MLDKMVQLNYINALVNITRRGDYNNLIANYIFIKLRDYNYCTKYNNYRGYCFTICKNILDNCKRYTILKYAYIYLLNPSKDNYLLFSKDANLSPLFVYIIYKFAMLYSYSFQRQTIFCLKLFVEGPLNINVNVVACNRLYLNCIKFGCPFKLKLKLLLRRGFFLFLYLQLYSAIVYYLLRCTFSSVDGIRDGILY